MRRVLVLTVLVSAYGCAGKTPSLASPEMEAAPVESVGDIKNMEAHRAVERKRWEQAQLRDCKKQLSTCKQERDKFPGGKDGEKGVISSALPETSTPLEICKASLKACCEDVQRLSEIDHLSRQIAKLMIKVSRCQCRLNVEGSCEFLRDTGEKISVATRAILQVMEHATLEDWRWKHSEHMDNLEYYRARNPDCDVNISYME